MSAKPRTTKEQLDALWTVLLGVNGEDGFIKETRASLRELIEAINRLAKTVADHVNDPLRAVERFVTKEQLREITEAEKKAKGEKDTLREARRLTKVERRLLVWAIVGTVVSLLGIARNLLTVILGSVK